MFGHLDGLLSCFSEYGNIHVISICVSIVLSSILRNRIGASESIGVEHILEIANFIHIKILPIIISTRTKWKKHLIHPYTFTILFRMFFINDMWKIKFEKVYIYISMDEMKCLDGVNYCSREINCQNSLKKEMKNLNGICPYKKIEQVIKELSLHMSYSPSWFHWYTRPMWDR